MKAKLLENNVKIYLSADEASPSVGVLNSGAEVELGKVIKVNVQPWVEIVDGAYVKGYIKGGAKVFAIRKYQLDQDEIIAYDLPAATGLEKNRYKRGAVLEKIDEIADATKKWFKVKDASGAEGFIDASAALIEVGAGAPAIPPVIPAATSVPPKLPLSRKAQAKKDMLTGGAFFVVGLIVTIVSIGTANSGGGYYLLCWGPVIFGAIQFFKGLANYAKKE